MDVLEAIKNLRNVRKFLPAPIPEEKIKLILTSARYSLSADNYQPWKFIVVNDDEIKRKLGIAANNQKFIAEAPIVIVVCGLPGESMATIGGYMSSYTIDVAFAMCNLMLTAFNEGLSFCWVFSFNEDRVRELLNVPQDVRVVGIIPIGYSNEKPEPGGRKNLTEIVCYNQYK